MSLGIFSFDGKINRRHLVAQVWIGMKGKLTSALGALDAGRERKGGPYPSCPPELARVFKDT
jgi:hypothetical protein